MKYLIELVVKLLTHIWERSKKDFMIMLSFITLFILGYYCFNSFHEKLNHAIFKMDKNMEQFHKSLIEMKLEISYLNGRIDKK